MKTHALIFYAGTNVFLMLLMACALFAPASCQQAAPWDKPPLLLMGFEGPHAIDGWTGVKCEITDQHTTEGRTAMRFTLPKWRTGDNQWPQVSIDWNNGQGYASKDWSGFDKLAFDVWVDGNQGDGTVFLSLEIRDKPENGWPNRFVIQPGRENRIELSIAKLIAIDPKNVQTIVLFSEKPPQDLVFTIDNFRLLPEERPAVADFDLLYPDYRNMIVPGAVDLKVSAKVRVAENNLSLEKLELELTGEGGGVKSAGRAKLQGDTVTVSNSAARIPAGSVSLTATLRDVVKGKALASQTWELRKLTPSQAAAEAPVRYSFPHVGKYQVLIGDFHMHTTVSDGDFTVHDRVEESYRKGYDVIAITDHSDKNYDGTRSYQIAKPVCKTLGLVLLRGTEVELQSGEHIGVIGVSDEFKNPIAGAWSETPGQPYYYKDVMNQVADSGGVIIYNHPHASFSWPALQWGIKHGIVVGIEVMNEVVAFSDPQNTYQTTVWNGIRCYPNCFDFALRQNLTFFADTDSHDKRRPIPAKTLIFAEQRSRIGVMDAIKAHRTAAWFEGVVWGRESLLKDMLNSMVKVRKTADSNLEFENLGSIDFEGRVVGAPGGRLMLPAHQTARTRLVDDGSADYNAQSVTVCWTNVWTTPTTTLCMDMAIKDAAR